jgi:uncharacterized lipoprotein YmbA
MRQRSLPLGSVGGAIRAALVVTVPLWLGACGSVPPARVHTLMPDVAARAGAASAANSAAPLAILLAPIRLPAQVDQPQWLIRLPDDSLALLEQERWASPLRDEFRDALLEELIVGFGAVEARGLPASAGAPLRVAVDVRRFDSLPGREARIEGSWSIAAADPRAPASRCEWLIREPAAGSLPALAAAHRRAVVRLADAIGDGLVRARRGEAPACPSLDDRGPPAR